LQNDIYRLNGEVASFKYNFFYFRNGNKNGIDQKESSEVTLPRLRLNAYKRVVKTQFLGLRYGLDNFKDLKIQEGGMLEKMEVLVIDRGVYSSVGLGSISDRLDHQFYPRLGSHKEITFDIDHSLTGSDDHSMQLSLDYTV
jgi:hypothetical protein